MILSEFREMIRLMIPGAKIGVIKNSKLDALINKGVNEVNLLAGAYTSDKKFTVVDDQADYLFSAVINDYLSMDKSGLWWNEGTATTPNWLKLDNMSRYTLDTEYPLWRDDSSGNPLHYVTKNDNLLIHPAPDTGLSDGFWAYYIKKATPMTNASHYPFTGSTVEITALNVLDEPIVDYVRWKLSTPLGRDQKGVISKKDFRDTLARHALLLDTRLDIAGARMKGPQIT